jgi:hypothetical protein
MKSMCNLGVCKVKEKKTEENDVKHNIFIKSLEIQSQLAIYSN